MGAERERRQRIQQAQRTSVLMAAAALFGRTGYEQTTMADIARVAGLAVGTLYKLYPSKQALHLALLEYHADAILEHDPRRGQTELAKTSSGHATEHATEHATDLAPGWLAAWVEADATAVPGGESSGDRRERTAAAKRGEILAAAAAVFQAKSFHGAAMADIAAAAGVATGTLYNFFPSKQALFQTLVDEKAAEFFAHVRSAVDPAAPAPDQIAQLVAAECSFYAASRDFLRIYVSARSGFEWAARQELGAAFHRRYAEHLAWVAELLAAGMQAGTLRPFDPLELAQALAGMLSASLFEWTIADQDQAAAPSASLAERAERITRLFLYGAQAQPANSKS